MKGDLRVAPSVRLGSDPLNYWMDFLDTWLDDRPICPIDSRLFRILMQMANYCMFLCQNYTFLLIVILLIVILVRLPKFSAMLLWDNILLPTVS